MADPRTYTISIKWAGNTETNTEVWIAEVAVFGSGAVAHGPTRYQAMTNAEQIIESAIYAHQQQGIAIPEEATGF